MNILLSANENFIKYAEDLLFSIKKNNKDERLNIYFLYLEISTLKIQELKKYVEEKIDSKINFLKLDPNMFLNLPTTNKERTAYFGPEAYLRLFAQYILPNNIDRVLYLDIDILCNGSLKELYYIDFNENCFIACEDMGATLEDKKRVCLKSNDTYINSGVLLMNLNLLRKLYSIEELKNYIYKNKNILAYPDQDILNKLYKGKFFVVSNKYNYAPFKGQSKMKNVVLYHFVGRVKPWNTKEIYKIKTKFFLIYLKNEAYKKKYFRVIYLSIYYSIFRGLLLLKKIILKLLRREI